MPKLNEEKLAEELNIEAVEAEVVEIKDNLKVDNNQKSADQFLVDNIERANRILDILELNAIKNESISARQAEVMAQLINSVTNAANSIISDEYNKEYLQIRKSVILLKEKELRIKELGTGGYSGPSERLIVTDRESILQILRESKDGKIPDIKQLEEGASND